MPRKINRYGFKHGGWSTRCKNENNTLTKHVNRWALGHKKYRVCRKVNGKTITFGYFDSQYEANAFKRAAFYGS